MIFIVTWYTCFFILEIFLKKNIFYSIQLKIIFFQNWLWELHIVMKKWEQCIFIKEQMMDFQINHRYILLWVITYCQYGRLAQFLVESYHKTWKLVIEYSAWERNRWKRGLQVAQAKSCICLSNFIFLLCKYNYLCRL